MSITDKFSKRVTTVAGKSSFFAEECTVKLIEALTDWGNVVFDAENNRENAAVDTAPIRTDPLVHQF